MPGGASTSVSVSSHEGDGYSWTMARARPHPGLAGVVAGPHCGYAERADAAFRRREVATGNVTLIISFGEQIDLVEMTRFGTYQPAPVTA